MSPTRVRRATPADLDALVAFPDDPGLLGLPRVQVRADLEAGRLRPEWSWLLERDGRVLGRALWWGRGDSPSALETLDVLPEVDVDDPGSAAGELLRAGHARLAGSGRRQLPTYTLRLRPGWRDDAEATRAVTWRREAAAGAGLTRSLERLQYAWTPEAGVPEASTRVRFRPGPDEEFVDLFRHAARGSLDDETRRALRTVDGLTQAREDFAFYESCPGERDWWRVATDGDGGPVGFVVPSATPYHRNVGYLGVLPSHRGQGLVDDLLGEVTRIHAQAGAQTITATTDLTNLPMAAAFDRAGYRVTEIRLVLEEPGPA